MLRFTSEDAYAAHAEGEPIFISRVAADRIIRDHHADPADYHTPGLAYDPTAKFDAWAVLEWLGY